jgi:hypothetical protein
MTDVLLLSVLPNQASTLPKSILDTRCGGAIVVSANPTNGWHGKLLGKLDA